MANKRSLLSWLFKSGQEEPQEPAQPSEAPVRVEPPPSPPAADPFRLELAPEHAVYKLRRLWQEEAGSQPIPSFRFETPDGGEVLPAARPNKSWPGCCSR